MQHADAETVDRVLDYASLIEAIRQAHPAGNSADSLAAVMGDAGDDDNKFVSFLAWESPKVIAVKLVGVFPGKLRLAVPTLRPGACGPDLRRDGRPSHRGRRRYNVSQDGGRLGTRRRYLAGRDARTLADRGRRRSRATRDRSAPDCPSFNRPCNHLEPHAGTRRTPRRHA